MRSQTWQAVFRQSPGGARAKATVLIWAALILAGRTESVPGEFLESKPLPGASAVTTNTLFARVFAQEMGIDLIHKLPANVTLEALQDQRSGSGVCAGDYDDDGWPDLYFSNYDRGNRLYRNLGHGRFADVTAAAGVTGEGRWCGGVSFVDIDQDGDLDLFVCAFNAPNLLYVNQGNGTFREEAARFGLNFAGASVMMSFADIDRDGDLDGYLVTARLALDRSHGLPKSARDALQRGLIRLGRNGEIQIPPAYEELFATLQKPNGRSELIIAGQRDLFYRNNGQGKFEEVSTAFGIDGRDIGLAATWWDFDDDGFPDLYVSNDYKGPDRLYHNRGGARFEEVTRSALPAIPYASMGSDLADVNNDGRFDFLATDMAGSTRAREVMNYSDLGRDLWFLQSIEPRQYRRNMLFVNSGSARFFEAAYLTGLAATDWTWSPRFGDLDNDGLIDVIIANGMSRDFVNRDIANQAEIGGESRWLSSAPLLESNRAFRNLGDLQFQEVSRHWGLDLVSASYGATLADLDRDGDLDLVVTNFEEAPGFFLNQSHDKTSVLIRLKGRQSNSFGVGAKLVAHIGAQTQARYLTLARGFMSADEPIAHFGCGTAPKIDRLIVHWPNGTMPQFESLEAGRFYTVTEPPESTPPASPVISAPALFAASTVLTGIRHREQPFDDFEREPLLPFKLSQSGPGLTVADVNGDGLDDFYLSGAAGFAGMLFLAQEHGAFARRPQSAFDKDRDCEDLGALLFDADSDGDLDLYVVSGGVECDRESEWLEDRLYLNNGHGDFTRADSGVLPKERQAGSAVCAADFDRDGDLDLFVGGRCVPGRYPETPPSILLRNDGGLFTHATQDLAPELMAAGLVTSALWTDANGDGWVDLLVACEWGPIRLFQNENGRLRETTKESGLAQITGLWSSLAAGDFDGDGDLDYVAGNLGLNTRYEASPHRPVTLFWGDFENRGQVDLLEGIYEGDRLFPMRGKTTLAETLPSLMERIGTFAEFGRTTVPDLLGTTLLKSAHRLEAGRLESGIFQNDGTGWFEFKALPRLAQIAPVFGLTIEDFDGDGLLDLFLAQNFSGARPETGKFNGGFGLLMRSVGRETMEPELPGASGLQIPGDARACASTDLNRDGAPDLMVAINDGPLHGFVNTATNSGRRLRLTLRGRKGNPQAVGAFVRVLDTKGSAQVAEVHAGGGFLSQNSGAISIPMTQDKTWREIIIRWPDGTKSIHSPKPTETHLEIYQPQPDATRR
jgi:enediyne biosynthesis protein E4